MKRIVCLLVSASMLSGGAAFAQSEIDAYRYSQTELSGTARYLSMGGAFGALGGDISAMSTNPAGLGIYRSSEVVTTLSLSSVKTNTNLNGMTSSMSKTKFNFDNIAFVGYFPTGNDDGIKGWNVGFSYNRLKDFNRSYRVSGKQAVSLSDYVADITNGIKLNDLQFEEGKYDPYFDSEIPWLSILGYESRYYVPYKNSNNEYHSAFGDDVSSFSPSNSDLFVKENGSIGQYDFSFATNVSDRFFLGATVAITDMNYRLSTEYTEQFIGKDYLALDNGLSTDGTGYAFNIGAIYRPLDFLRLGVAYNSPTWYKMTDYFHGKGSTYLEGEDAPFANETPEKQAANYRLRTADRWIFSAAGTFGQSFLVSVDYELTNYKRMFLSDQDGNDAPHRYTNQDIKSDFGNSGTLKAGLEYKVTPQFAVRAGGTWRNSPMNANLKDGLVEVITAGTVPNYTVDKGSESYSVGLGYRFTPNFYADLACVYRLYKEDVYAFSKTFYEDGKVMINSDPASLKTKTTQVALTLGYKF